MILKTVVGGAFSSLKHGRGSAYQHQKDGGGQFQLCSRGFLLKSLFTTYEPMFLGEGKTNETT